MFTVLLAYVVFCLFVCLFFACFVVRDLCRSGCRQNYYLTTPHPLLIFSLPTILSLTQVTVIEISARLKLVSVPFSSLLLDIGHLEKSFPESIM